MNIKSKLIRYKPSLFTLFALGVLALLLPKSGHALNTTDIVTKVDEVSAGITSVIKSNGIKVISITMAWASVGIFALFHKPLGRALLGAFVVTAVVVFMNKWA